jgi:hypothetical protein
LPHCAWPREDPGSQRETGRAFRRLKRSGHRGREAMRGLSPGEARAVAAASMMTGRLQRFQTRTMRPPGTLPARCAALFASLERGKGEGSTHLQSHTTPPAITCNHPAITHHATCNHLQSPCNHTPRLAFLWSAIQSINPPAIDRECCRIARSMRLGNEWGARECPLAHRSRRRVR